MSSRNGSLLVPLLALALAGSASSAPPGHYYGVVESFGGGEVVLRTTQHSTGHWRVDGSTRVTGAVMAWDWAFVEVEPSGHVKVLRSEEHATPRSGVVKEVHGNVLTDHSGNAMERWNLVETTLASGVEPGDLHPGDAVGVKVFKNHNLAEVRLVKRGAQ